MAECALVEIIEDTLGFLVPLDQGIRPYENASRALVLYLRLMDWKASLLDELGLETIVIPSAIILQ